MFLPPFRSIKPELLNGYRIASESTRLALREEYAEERCWPAGILFYHRVADDNPNDWTISKSLFASQIDWLQSNSKIVSLREIQQSQNLGVRDQFETAITFDDGYADNLEFALPMLAERGIPVTYFVSTGFIGLGKRFDHDLKISQDNRTHTELEIRQIAEMGIEIGGHTETHLNLGLEWSPETLRREILDSRKRLQDLTGQSIDYFAFPFGLHENISQAAVDTVLAAGYRGFVSAYGDWNWPSVDARHLRRIHGDPCMASFTNWLTFDPRKSEPHSNIPFQPLNITNFTNRPLRTGFVITSMPVGGAETLLVNLIRQFNPNRITPILFCLKEPGPLGDELADEIPVESNLIRGKYDIDVTRRLAKLFRKHQLDAVVTVGAGDKMFWGRLAARLAKLPVIASALHSTGWPDGVGRLNRMLTPITDRFIAVAKPHGEFLVDFEKFPARKVAVIANGIDTNRFVPDKNVRDAVLSELNLPSDAKVVGIVAALRSEKNHELFIKTARDISKSHADAHFLIIGDGPERPSIENWIRQYDLGANVHLLGTRSDTERLLAAMDVFLLTSHNEANPVSILEALSCETPVVATDVGSISETVINDKTGFLVPAGGLSEMTKAVSRLLSDAQLRQKLGHSGRSLVVETSSLQSMVSGYESLIHGVYCEKRPDERDVDELNCEYYDCEPEIEFQESPAVPLLTLPNAEGLTTHTSSLNSKE